MSSTLVGREAPDFTAAAVLNSGEIVSQFQLSKILKENKYVLMFFYPLDFTFVCPSELIALDRRIEQFRKLNVEVMGISIDSQFTHIAWRNTPIQTGGIGPVNYTLIADTNHRICQTYGVEHPEAGVAFRASILIDPKGIVRSQMVNDLPIGRNIDELLRLIKALQFHETHGGFTVDDFAKSHPGGRLGRRLLLKVEEIMHTGNNIPRVIKESMLIDAMIEMSAKRLGFTTIVDAQDPECIIGVFTDGDLRRAISQGSDVHQTAIHEVMTKKFTTVSSQMLATEAIAIMEKIKTLVMPVINEKGKLVGAFNMHDLFKAGVM